MKALFSRLTGGSNHHKSTPREREKDTNQFLTADSASDARSFRDKAHPPLPPLSVPPLDAGTSGSLSSALNTPSMLDRELPSIVPNGAGPIGDGIDDALRTNSILDIPASMLSNIAIGTGPAGGSGTVSRSSLAVDIGQRNTASTSASVSASASASGASSSSRQPTRRTSQQHLERVTSRPGGALKSSQQTANSGATASSSSSGTTPQTSGGGGGTTKKVAFISPQPTGTTLASPIDAYASSSSSSGPGALNNSNGMGSASGTSTPASRARSPQPGGGARNVSDATLRMGGYTPGAPGGSTATVNNMAPSRPSNAYSNTLNASSAYLGEATSMRSATPMSYLSGRTGAAGIQAAASWSEAAEEDLVSNLGSRERTRQEVLWEIVASEDRYVVELLKFKETFIDPLLHPYSTSVPSIASPALADPLPAVDYNSNTAYFRSETPMTHRTAASIPRESLDNLPIASRFLSTPTPTPGSDSESGGRGAMTPTGGRKPAHKRSTITPSTPTNPALGLPDVDAISIDDPSDVPSDMDGMDEDAMGRGYASGANRVPGRGNRMSTNPYNQTPKKMPFPSGLSGARSHQSLPPPARTAGAPTRASATSLVGGMQVGVPHTAQNSTRGGGGRNGGTPNKLSRRVFGFGSSTTNVNTSPGRKESTDSVTLPQAAYNSAPSSTSPPVSGGGLAPRLLPEDLRKCLEVLEGGILSGHVALSDGLRKRYEEQYPLVRSLADVFIANSHILQEYATYVLHLERALEQVDDALSTVALAKKPKKQDIADWMHVSRVLKQLEDNAAEKGETGLAISLSKPFQRLLKYPLLFQNLLFHTDPSTFEYESTLEMVAEVEKIVRSIEDEKIQQEERDKTRDVLARIEGLDKIKALAAPKASRQIVSEKPLFAATAPSKEDSASKSGASGGKSTLAPPTDKKVNNKSSFRRFSDVLQPGGTHANPTLGGKKDLWLVKFNDVVLRCQRTGTTTLPITSTIGAPGGISGRTHSLPELAAAGKASKSGTTGTGRRTVQTKPRNLYKFLKIETWTIGDLVQSGPGVVAMEDISKVRSRIGDEGPPKGREEPLPEDNEDNESDDSDRKSKMSFSYWGADKITVQAAGAKARGKQAAKNAVAARRGPAPTAYQSAANAKFGGRLRSPEPGDTSPSRPASRRTGLAPLTAGAGGASSVRKPSTDTINKPPTWGSMGAKANNTPTPIPRRVQKLSTPTPPKSDPAKLQTPNAKAKVDADPPPASPTPSEGTQDSGVGLTVDRNS
ncbi:Dbl homology domain-containing protein [Clavulina sp. PMI_390]|nr:Dbl homology domain-containing protein [Clavulina sp. PMI_390]